jgi:hypothetical protein
MIGFAMALAASTVSPPERCEAVRRDHEEFKAWVKSSLSQFDPKVVSPESRGRWDSFDRTVDAKITELNRRYANCRQD